MKKLISLLLLLSSIVAVALNFSGHQSLNGLQTQKIFTAPAAGYYFVNGQLTLPQTSSGSSPSGVAAIVTSTASPALSYTGVSGASGFQIRQILLASGDSVSVELRSSATVDQGINAVRGEVQYGNSF
jgi:hypothetical protein